MFETTRFFSPAPAASSLRCPCLKIEQDSKEKTVLPGKLQSETRESKREMPAFTHRYSSRDLKSLNIQSPNGTRVVHSQRFCLFHGPTSLH